MRRFFLPVVLVLTVVATACTVTLGDKAEQRSTSSTSTADTYSSPIPDSKEPVAAVTARVLPAVVNVTSKITSADGQSGQGVGSGFIVRSDGVIVTNCHVVEGASEITVFTSEEEPTEYDARLLGADCQHDLAVLKVDATDLPTVALGGSADLRLGQRVVAIGYALGLDGGPSVTTGIVSSLDRTIQVQDPGCDVCETNQSGQPFRTYSDVIQTDAAINHGNSGGPLLDMQGNVIGINSAGNDQAENIGFAIAIDSAKDTISASQQDPLAPQAYLGVSTDTVDGAVAAQQDLTVDHGAYVVSTTSDGPAGAAGVEAGDVIVAIDGADVTTPEDISAILSDLRPGDEVSIVLVGPSGDERTIELSLGSRPIPAEIP
ncbi:MAG TPA: trypsin-like peptidase domain-containing protein [Actinomycetota bacterium]